jgi:hypothetical protein
MEKLDQVRMEAEYRVAKTRDMLSFRWVYPSPLFQVARKLPEIAEGSLSLRREFVRCKYKSRGRDLYPVQCRRKGSQQNLEIQSPAKRVKRKFRHGSWEIPTLVLDKGLKTCMLPASWTSSPSALCPWSVS